MLNPRIDSPGGVSRRNHLAGCDTHPGSPHFVEFYEEDRQLTESVSCFFRRAIREGSGVISIATAAHRDWFNRELERDGVDLQAVRDSSQYLELDAEETLARFMVGDSPDYSRFVDTIEPVLSQLEHTWPHVCAFGEMVAILTARGNPAAACQLEQFWNQIAATHEFSLFCAYPLGQFADASADVPFADICASHSYVIPGGSDPGHATPSPEARDVALLRHKAIRLDREMELRRTAEKGLADFVEHALVGLRKMDREGRILWANRFELEMLGYQPDEYIGHAASEFVLDQDALESLLARVAAGETVANFPARLRCKDGGFRHVRLDTNGQFEGGRFGYSRCVTRDVTDTADFERDRAMLATIVSSSQDAIITKTLDGIITSWNAAAERMLGYTASQAIGRSIKMLIPIDRLAEEEDILAKLRRGERIEHYETVRVARDGRCVDISLTISPIRDSEGRIVGASKIARDVTVRRASDRALRESEQRFATFMQSLPGLAWIKDANGRYCFANDAVSKPFGVSRGDLLGKTDDDLFDVATAAQFRENDRRALESEQGVRVIETLEQEDGVHYSIVSKFPIQGPEGTPDSIGGVAIDITDRIRAEHALLESDRRKDEFIATLAHELRNPLAPIRNSIQFLRLSADGSPASQRVHDMMERQVAHMVRLVDDLLEISRISRGKIELKRQHVELRAIVEQAIETSRPIIEGGAHRVEIRLPEEPVLVDGDVVRLSQVFSNLLNNASKYSPEPGTIELCAERRGNVVVTSVRDSGIGIPADMLSRVFDMFAQVDNPLRRHQDGLGIGLCLVRTLVLMHGGTVEARSEGLGRGSEFLVTLPIADADASDEARPESTTEIASDAGTACRILVVDDNRDAADSLGMMLRILGANVSIAYDGPSAIEHMKAFKPSIVLSDVGMPGMDGLELARKIRSLPGNNEVLVIALTGWGQDQDRLRTKEAGFDHHLVKPVELVALQSLLLAQGRRESEKKAP